MKSERLFIVYFMLLIITASFAHLSIASENYSNKKITAKKNSTSSEGVSNQKIPCDWEGWINSYPGVRCSRWFCDRHIQVLKMKCIDGFLTEVKVGRVCVTCRKRESPGL